MKEIKLSQQGKYKNKFVALIDDGDYDFLNQWRWCVQKCKRTFYASRQISVNKKRQSILMHRIILNAPISMEIDHIDHNGLNNQKSNLRICTHYQNNINRYIQNNTGYAGVYIRKYKDKKYIFASVKINNKSIHLGRFRTVEDAALARDKIIQKYRGEFANLNFNSEQNDRQRKNC